MFPVIYRFNQQGAGAMTIKERKRLSDAKRYLKVRAADAIARGDLQYMQRIINDTVYFLDNVEYKGRSKT